MLGSINIPAQSKNNNFADVDNIIETAISDSSFPGAVLLVQMNGKIIHEKAYGHYTYDPASGNISLNSMFDLASCTKVVATTTAAMICFDRGLFNIDDKVSEFLPQFAKNGKENITIKNLLVHDSGLPPDIKSYKIYNPNENKTNEIMNEIYNDSLSYPTGTKSVYSDLNFIILGKIIEKVTGVSLDKFCYKNIFKPLKMKSTMFNPPSSLMNRIVPTEIDNYWRFRLIRGTVHDETAQLLGGVAGHAGLFSTAGDIAKLLQMLLQKGRYKGRNYIKKSTVEMFTKKQSDISSRALGWDTKSPEYSSAGHLFSSLSYGHTGFTGTSIWVDPVRKLFVVLLTNRVYPTRDNLKILKVRPLVHDAIIQSISF
ncbi:MAG TPA: serine hydrolase [Ignavibacteriaceae bacterium]|nr:serine hydrolase [Ignavibacteriaceae bacterium]